MASKALAGELRGLCPMRPSSLPRVLVAVAGLLFTIPALAVSQPGHGHGSNFPKLDRALQETVASGAGPQRVIVHTRTGASKALEDALRAHGDVIGDEFPGPFEAFAAHVHAEDLEALADNQSVASVSIDALCVTTAATG